jgi:hypothetical protein
MDSMWRVFLPRIAAILAAWLVGWAADHQLTLDQEQVTIAMLSVYAFLHRVISRWVNPGDATKSVLVEEDKITVQSDSAELRRAPR